MKNNARPLALATCLAQAVIPQCAAAAAAFVLETAAPVGFSEFTQPQLIVADVYFGSRFLGTAQVVVTPESIHFQEPEAVLKLLPETLHPDVALRHLEEKLARNSQRVCHANNQSDCGYLEPEHVGAIYDESRFRVDLFLAKTLLPQQAAIKTPYLPDSSSGFSLVQNLTGIWSGVSSGTTDNRQSIALQGNTIASLGESALQAQWWASDEQRSGIQSLHWTRDYHGKAFSLGLFQPSGGFSYFANSQAVYGIEYRTSVQSRNDIDHQQGAPIEVNMPVRGRVEIYRNNQLIHSELLEGGNRLLNTSALPSGAYEIEVRTYDEAGRPLNRFTQLFAKDALLPPPNEWRWNIMAGKPALLGTNESIPEYYDDNLLQASVARRITDNTGFFATTATTNDQQLLELGARWIGNAFELSPSALETSDGRNGYRLQALLRTPYFTASVSELRLDRPATRIALDHYQLLASGYFQRNASILGELFGGQVSLRYNRRDQPQVLDSGNFNFDSEFTGARTLVTFEYRKSFIDNSRWRGDMSFSHSDADGEQYSAFGIQFRYRAPHWYNSVNLRSEQNALEGNEIRAGIQSRWNDEDIWAAQLEHQLTAETTGDAHFLESRAHMAGRRGFMHSSVSYADTADTTALNYAGAFSTNLITTGEEFAWGGEQSLQSAVIIDIDGSADQQFEILVDGNRRGYAKGGERSVVNLPAFESYDISLRPLDNNFYDYRETRESVTLYPGNVTASSYQIRPLILAFGRIMRQGIPVSNTRISIGEYSAVTDEFGVFQMEMYGDPRTLRAPDVQWKNCQVPLPEQTSGDDWLNLGVIDLSTAECPTSTDQGEQYAAH